MDEEKLIIAISFLLVGIFLSPITMLSKSSTVQKRVTHVTYEQANYSKVYQRAKNSVVSIKSVPKDPEETVSEGSGFIYDKKGHVVTNAHVVTENGTTGVYLPNGEVKEAKVIGIDIYTDIAVLKINASQTELEPLPLANSENVKVGQPIASIGSPFGFSSTITTGVISQKDRLLETKTLFPVPNAIQTDTPINPGNSGGPLVSVKGKVIGITTAIRSQIRQYSGVGFAVPSNALKEIVPKLIMNGKYPHSWIGIIGMNIPPEIARYSSKGFLVNQVAENSPADKAGLKAGTVKYDEEEITVTGDIITGINGKEVKNLEDLLSYLHENTAPNDTVTMTVIRNGEEKQLKLTLGIRPLQRKD